MHEALLRWMVMMLAELALASEMKVRRELSMGPARKFLQAEFSSRGRNFKRAIGCGALLADFGEVARNSLRGARAGELNAPSRITNVSSGTPSCAMAPAAAGVFCSDDSDGSELVYHEVMRRASWLLLMLSLAASPARAGKTSRESLESLY